MTSTVAIEFAPGASTPALLIEVLGEEPGMPRLAKTHLKVAPN